MKIKHEERLGPLLDALGAASLALDVRSSLVGGYVRDRLLDRPCMDLDVVVEDGAGLRLAAAVADRLHTHPPVVFERFGTAQVTWGDYLVDFVSARAEEYDPSSRKPEVRPGTLEEDIQRRDFTCNTLLADYTGNVLDVTGRGLEDIAARVLRTPLPAAATLSEDPLRMVRAVRFAATLGFTMDAALPSAMTEVMPRLRPGDVVSVERIRDEIRKMLLSPHPGVAVRLLHDTGMLALLMPEVATMAGVEQSGFHSDDVLNHTIGALEESAAPHGSPARADEDAVLVERLGILLHDVGKPATAVRDGERITFIGHPEVGMDIARDLLRRLRFSNEHADAVARLVELHMRPIQYDPAEWSDGAVRRLVRDAGERLPQLLELARVDMASSDYPAARAERKLSDLRQRIEQVGAEGARRATAPLDGNALMARYGLAAGPWIGRVQAALLDAVLDGELDQHDPSGAWAWLAAHPEHLPAGGAT
ncbi:MAG: CCA tRNA nucleotidyltransferase [Candidatus Dormibacteria bacterium]